MVRRTDSALRAKYRKAAASQTVECLRACHLVAIVAVDIYLRGTALYVGDSVGIPDFIKKSFSHDDSSFSKLVDCVYKSFRTGPVSRNQVETLTRNAGEFGLTLFGLGHERNGIIHVMGPENGLTLPGATIVCGDSHTSTHGAFGAVAFGIGTSEVEMVLATQCILQPRPRTMRINVEGTLASGVTGPKAACATPLPPCPTPRL